MPPRLRNSFPAVKTGPPSLSQSTFCHRLVDSAVQVAADFARLTDPEAVAERRQSLFQAEVAHQDALAHQARIARAETASDDDRIEAMFYALRRMSKEQQTLVFTSRQVAFAALGWERASVAVEAI